MGPPAGAVLDTKQAVKMIRQIFSNPVEVVRNDPERDPSPQVHQPGDVRPRRRQSSGEGKRPLRFV